MSHSWGLAHRSRELRLITACQTDSGLADELIEQMGAAYPAGSGDNLAKVAQYFEYTAYDRSQLYDYLHERFEKRAPKTAAVAEMLASLPKGDRPLFIITTNYDSIIEGALRSKGRPLCVITQNLRDPALGAQRITLKTPSGETRTEDSFDFQWNDDQFPAETCFLFKMHGSTAATHQDGRDDIIITEDDYVSFLVQSGGGSAPNFPPPSLTRAYKERRFLFLGYSLYDWNFRAFLHMLAMRNALSGREARRHWAIQLAPDEYEIEIWRHRNVNIYDGDLVQFCDRLLKMMP